MVGLHHEVVNKPEESKGALFKLIKLETRSKLASAVTYIVAVQHYCVCRLVKVVSAAASYAISNLD